MRIDPSKNYYFKSKITKTHSWQAQHQIINLEMTSKRDPLNLKIWFERDQSHASDWIQLNLEFLNSFDDRFQMIFHWSTFNIFWVYNLIIIKKIFDMKQLKSTCCQYLINVTLHRFSNLFYYINFYFILF